MDAIGDSADELCFHGPPIAEWSLAIDSAILASLPGAVGRGSGPGPEIEPSAPPRSRACLAVAEMLTQCFSAMKHSGRDLTLTSL